MRTRTFTFTLVAALVALLTFSGSGFAKGPGGGGGGGSGDAEIPDYGDLIKLYRDADGVPIPSPLLVGEFVDPETGEMVDGGLCWQPLAFNVEDTEVCPTDCVVATTPATVDVNQYSCGVAEGCSGCTQEVNFERINSARSPASVYESQLADVIVNLATADCRTLDPAGRMVASRVGDDDVVTSSAIDSPLQNLAIYRQLMLTGELGVPLPQDADVLDTAARGLGAGSGKGGEVNVDLVAYLNQIMGLTDPATVTILDPKICETYREEVQGVIKRVEKCFLNYGTETDPSRNAYEYGRTENFGALPAPAYIPGGGPVEGSFEYLAVLDSNIPSFQILQGPIMDGVFENEASEGNIGGFAQAADDARAVINFMHDWPMPDADIYATPVVCEASDDIFYDLSISEESGLQVPKNYVSGGEREFFVNVANLGPDTANGTVTVVATNGETLDEWTLTIVELPAGQTDSFTVSFTFDTTSDTINWTATVVADLPGTDPNSGNDSVDAVSNVKASGGGGGH